MFRLAFVVLASACLRGQAFEVASVKANKSNANPTSNFPLGPGDVYTPNGGRFLATGQPLIAYLSFAYKMNGGDLQTLRPQLPEWALTERFDIEARATGNPGKDDMRKMMRALLADRFKLAIHHESREVPVMALVAAKPGRFGPQLKPHVDDRPCAEGKCNGVFEEPPSVAGRRKFEGLNVTLAFMANALSAGTGTGRPLIDKTGLNGTFDFSIEFAMEGRGGGADADAGPSFANALQDQLGLKLESRKSAMDVMVVDHVERPSAN